MSNLVIVPGSPALVAELSPADEAGARLRGAVRGLVAGEDRPIDVVASHDPRWHTAHTGSFRAWGAGVTVGGGNHLPELVARYLLGPAENRVRNVRDVLQPLDPGALTVLVLDGSAGLTSRAPLALVDGALEAHEAMRAFLGGKAELPEDLPGVIEPELWRQLAELTPSKARLVDHDATLGVGRFVAAWQVDHA